MNNFPAFVQRAHILYPMLRTEAEIYWLLSKGNEKMFLLACVLVSEGFSHHRTRSVVFARANDRPLPERLHPATRAKVERIEKCLM